MKRDRLFRRVSLEALLVEKNKKEKINQLFNKLEANL